ncbi:MAG: glycoside hydrolase family 3 N-terminal domain-containing protein [Phycisphaerae bacterium]
MNNLLPCGKNVQARAFAPVVVQAMCHMAWTTTVLLLLFMPAMRAHYLVAQPVVKKRVFGHCCYGLTPVQVDQRADQLLGRMTLGEKIRLLSGDPRGYYRSQRIRRLSIPPLDMHASSCGILGALPSQPAAYQYSTVYPASVCLAATWNRQLAYKEGVAIAHDCLARGVTILLGPGMNIEREPQDGRNFEFLGEDPFLTSAVEVHWIRGAQACGVAACAKHFAAYEDGSDGNIDSIVSRRALEEIYFPPFRAAVRQAHVWSIMCAYYKINGTFCAQNKWLLTDILRQHWGFKGVLMSDWGANHACVQSLNAGLDLEMPHAGFYTPVNIRKALADGSVSITTINEHVRRILRLMVAMGLLKHHLHPDVSIPLNDPAGVEVVRQVAAEGTVLLRNKNHILPLHRSRLKRIVVWGPVANVPNIIGGGSSSGPPVPGMAVSMLQALKKVAGPDVKVHYISSPLCVDSSPAPAKLNLLWGKGKLWTPQGHPGIAVEYFNNDTLTGQPVARGTDTTINFNWGINKPIPQITQVQYSALWRGEIKPAKTGAYEFVSSSDDGSRVLLNGREIIENWRPQGPTMCSAKAWLRAGKTYRLRITYFNFAGPAQMHFGYGFVSNQIFTVADQKRIAHANAVIACVGFGNQGAPLSMKYEGEGFDRSYYLWGLQNHILSTLAKRNARTIVVVDAGAGIGMSRWIHNVAGLLYAWYPGETGNLSVAHIIFGTVDPSGRLPDTFSRHWRDESAYGHWLPMNMSVHFSEGIYVGYRWYDKRHIKPLYPFGFGLSYTTFAMRHLHVTSTGSGKQRVFKVTAEVTNTGKMAGAQVAQLYIHPLVDRKNRCVQTLKGFARVNLRPGQSKTVTMKLDWRDFAYYNSAKQDWQVPPGKYEIAVGASSADEPLHETVQWTTK